MRLLYIILHIRKFIINFAATNTFLQVFLSAIILFVGVLLSSLICCKSKERSPLDSPRSSPTGIADTTPHSTQSSAHSCQPILHNIVMQELKVRIQENLQVPAVTTCENVSTEPSLNCGNSLYGYDNEKKTDYNPDTDPPQLPDRNYLNDIDFVIQEYDLILGHSSQLPNRSATSSLKNLDLPTEEETANRFCHNQGDSNPGAAIHRLAFPNVYNLTLPRRVVGTAVSPKVTSNHGSIPCGYPTNIQHGPCAPQISYRESPSTSQSGQQQLVPKSKSHRMISKEQPEYEADVYQNIHSFQQREPELETKIYQSLIFHHRDGDENQYMEVGRSLLAQDN